MSWEPRRIAYAVEVHCGRVQEDQLMAQMEVQASEVPLAVMPPYPVKVQSGVLRLVMEAGRIPDPHFASTTSAVP